MDFSRNTLLRNVNLQGESTAVRKSSAYQLQKTGDRSIHSFVTNPQQKFEQLGFDIHVKLCQVFP